MTTHSSVLAWQSQEQRSLAGYTVHEVAKVRYDWATKQQLNVYFYKQENKMKVSHQTAKKNGQFNGSWAV